jgi:hypothetical protein
MTHSTQRFPRAAGLILILSVVMLQACTLFKKEPFIIPEENTPREQFAVARDTEARAKGSFDKDVRRDEYNKAIAAYGAVISRFPSDLEFTPAAWLQRAELYYQFGSDDPKHYAKAIEGFRIAADKYSNQDDIRVASLWGLGRTYDMLARDPDSSSRKAHENQTNAQMAYKAVIEEFNGHESQAIRALVEQARLRYRIVR